MAEEKQDETTKPEETVAAPAPADQQNTPDDDAEEPVSEFPEETWVTDEDWVDDINTRWRDVISHLMKGKRIYDAYAKAYDIDITTPRGYNVARAAGSRLLANVNFKRLMRKVIAENGFNDEMADMGLLDLMTNPGYEPAVRRAAIKDYNELNGRIVKKLDHTSKGKRIEAPVIMSEIKPRDDNTADS